MILMDDIHVRECRYFREVELGNLLKKMTYIGLQLIGKHTRSEQADTHEGLENSREHSWTWWRIRLSLMNTNWKWWRLMWRNKDSDLGNTWRNPRSENIGTQLVVFSDHEERDENRVGWARAKWTDPQWRELAFDGWTSTNELMKMSNGDGSRLTMDDERRGRLTSSSEQRDSPMQ